MTQEERLDFLINYLKGERAELSSLEVPSGFDERRTLLRSLVNVREPAPVSDEFIKVQDEYLQCELGKKHITSIDELTEAEPGIYLWQGDITRLKVDAIVNAANSAALGCFIPCHPCIDNIIHTNAGVQLRGECDAIMKQRGAPLETGEAIITGAYNLPSRFVLHTVGPIVSGAVTQSDRTALAQCYRSCLTLCKERGIKSIAFCCISTGVFHFPNGEAAQVAVSTVQDFMLSSIHRPFGAALTDRSGHPDIKVVFNVFKNADYAIYQGLLG